MSGARLWLSVQGMQNKSYPLVCFSFPPPFTLRDTHPVSPESVS